MAKSRRKKTGSKNELWYIASHGRAGKRIRSSEARALHTLIKAEKARGGAGFLGAAEKVLKANGFSEMTKTSKRRRRKK